MKILHIYKDYYPVIGGIENYIRTLAEYQVQQGMDVMVLTTSTSGQTKQEDINGVKVIKAGRLIDLARTPISLSMLLWAQRIDVDIAHLHFPYPFGEFANYFFGKARKTVITYHSDIIKQRFILQFYKPLLMKVLYKADRIIATSPRYIETSPFLKRVKDKCTVIPLGIDLDRFKNPGKTVSDSIKEQYSKRPIILFVGRLRYFKGLKYLIEAMKSVDAVLLISGIGPEEENLKAQVRKEGLTGKVIFLGDVPDRDLPSYYDACDLFVLPASQRSEAFGTVLIEAMAAGKAVISTELGTGPSFVNIHNKTGLVVPPKDSQELSRAINMLLADGALREKFANNAFRRAGEFSSERLNKSIIELYRELVK